MKAIIFDLDGTLIDSFQATYHAMLIGLEYLQIPKSREVTLEEALPYTGGSMVDFMNLFIEKSYCNPHTMQKLYSAMPDIYNRKFFDTEIVVYNGVLKTLTLLKSKGILLSVVSNSPQKVVEELCLHFFNGLFDFMYGDQGGKQVKPNPVGILSAMNALQLLPEEVIFVGDTIVDAQTAAAAGVAFVGAMWSNTEASNMLKQSGCPTVNAPSQLFEYA